MPIASRSPERTEVARPMGVLSPEMIRTHIGRLNSEFAAVLPKHEYLTQGPFSFETDGAKWVYQLGGPDSPTIVVRSTLLALARDGQRNLRMETATSRIFFGRSYPSSPRLRPWGRNEWAISETVNNKAAVKAAEHLLEQLREDLPATTEVVFYGTLQLS